MGDVITRKCACCKNEIVIDVDDVRDVVYFEGLYYHSTCFEEMAARKAASKRGKPQKWQDALDRLWELEAESKKMLEYRIAQDELNEWLLEHYDIVEVPKRFWQVVADLGAGKRNGKKCKPLNVCMLRDLWKWGQTRLDQIAVDNQSKAMGPSTDVDRIRYDFAILLKHVEDFKKHQNKVAAEKIEARIYKEKENHNINYNNISKSNGNKNMDGDISDILDEIFG